MPLTLDTVQAAIAHLEAASLPRSAAGVHRHLQAHGHRVSRNTVQRAYKQVMAVQEAAVPPAPAEAEPSDVERQALEAPLGEAPPRTAVQSAQHWLTSCQGRVEFAQATLAAATTRLLAAGQALRAAEGVTIEGVILCQLHRASPDWLQIYGEAKDADQQYHAARLDCALVQEAEAQARRALHVAETQAHQAMRRQAARLERPDLFAELEAAVARLAQLRLDREDGESDRDRLLAQLLPDRSDAECARQQWIIDDLEKQIRAVMAEEPVTNLGATSETP